MRWFWPGELGEDVLEKPTIAFEPFEYRYHPQVRAREGLLPWAAVHRGILGPDDPGYSAGGARSHYWARAQRLQLCELPSPGGHGFPGGFGPEFNWYDRFFESHPEYFALQPDGTRSAFPSVGNIKMCHSSPGLAEQWLDDVAAQQKLDRAREQVADGPDVYRDRIAFVQAGLDFTRLFIDCGRLVRNIEQGEDPDGVTGLISRGIRATFPDDRNRRAGSEASQVAEDQSDGSIVGGSDLRH